MEKSEKFALRGYDHILGGRIFITLFPAYAGVIPKYKLQVNAKYALPRVRGGDSMMYAIQDSSCCSSPRMRG